MHGADLDGRSIRVEKARRNNGYQKTPGVCKYHICSAFDAVFVFLVLRVCLTCIPHHNATQILALLN